MMARTHAGTKSVGALGTFGHVTIRKVLMCPLIGRRGSGMTGRWSALPVAPILGSGWSKLQLRQDDSSLRHWQLALCSGMEARLEAYIGPLR